MKCFCCNQDIANDDIPALNSGWHQKCIQRFFGTHTLPELDVDENTLKELASKTIRAGHTIAGVQKKLSLHLSRDIQPKLTIVNYPNGYILKPPEPKYPCITELEHLTLLMAEKVGIDTVEHALIRIKTGLAFITKRMDRSIYQEENTKLYAMEDFAQLTGRPTADKYKGSYERAAEAIDLFSFSPPLDKARYFERLVFCYLTGNSDMHLKNFSLRETKPGSRKYQLSPAYDLLPVNLVLPEDKEMTALTLNGKKKNLRRKDFMSLAQQLNIPKSAAVRILIRLVEKKEVLEEIILTSSLPDSIKQGYIQLIEQRTALLG